MPSSREIINIQVYNQVFFQGLHAEHIYYLQAGQAGNQVCVIQ